MVEGDTARTSSLFLLAIFGHLRIGATDEEALLQIALHQLPEASILKHLTSLRSREVIFFRHTTRDVDHALAHLTTIQELILLVKLGVGLFDEGYPEFLWVGASGI